jgi:HlyD family secretion protein
MDPGAERPLRSHPRALPVPGGRRVLGVLLLLLAGCDGTVDAPPAVGTLERDRIDVVADSAEPLLEVRVREGDRVRAGDVLFVQDDRRARAALERARAEADAARAALDEAVHGPRPQTVERARAHLAAAESEVALARRELARAEPLVERGLVPVNDVDVLRSRLAQASARRRALERELAELEAGTRAEVVQRLRMQLRAAEQRLVDVELALERTRPTAPVDGRVEAVLRERGERPAIGQTVVALLDGSRLYARVHVPEPVRARLEPGARARITVRGRDGTIPGTLRWIAGEAAFTPYYALTQQDGSRLAYRAEVDVDRPDGLPVGVPVEVRFPEPAGTGAPP